MRNLFLGSVALLLLGTPFVYTWRITRIEIRVSEGLCLLVMCSYVKGQLPISRLWHLWVRECYFCGKSNFWGIFQLFIWRVCDVMLAWPLSMFSLAIWIFNRFFFYFGYVSPLLFVSKVAENAPVQDSTCLLPVWALKFAESLSTSFSLTSASARSRSAFYLIKVRYLI